MTIETTQQPGRGEEDKTAIYVADLADYNAGELRGRWITIEPTTDINDLEAEISELLAEKGHEEYAIHDYDNIPSSQLGEYPNLEDVLAVAEAVHEYGYELVEAYINDFDIEDLSKLEDRYLGTYESLEDYAYDYIDSCYDLETMMGNLAMYFDYESFARDLQLGGDVICIELRFDEVAIFTSC